MMDDGEKPLEGSRISAEEIEWKKYKMLSTQELRKLGKNMSVSAAELQGKKCVATQTTKEWLSWKKYVPIGYRFDPTDYQLLKYYLLARVNGAFFLPGIIEDVDVYQCHPAKIPELNKEDEFSYFFTPRDRRYQSGTRLSRTTKDGNGHWKMTSKITPFRDVDNSDLGRRNTLVYHEKGPSDKDVKTNWIMHEYVLDESLCFPLELPSSSNTNTPRDIVLCRIYKRKQNQEDKKSQNLHTRDVTNDNDNNNNNSSANFSKDGNQPKRKLPSIPDLNVQSSCNNHHVSEPHYHQEASKRMDYDPELPFSKRKRSRTSGAHETFQSRVMIMNQGKPTAWMNVSDFLKRNNSMTMTHSNREKFLIQYRGTPAKVEQHSVWPNCKDESGDRTDTPEEKGKSLVYSKAAEQKFLVGLTNDVNKRGEMKVGNIDKKPNDSQIGRVEGSLGDAATGDGSSSASSSS